MYFAPYSYCWLKEIWQRPNSHFCFSFLFFPLFTLLFFLSSFLSFLLSPSFSSFRVWTGSRLRNLRRLLFADTPFLLHEASQIFKNLQQERKEERGEHGASKDQPAHQQEDERSLSSSSSSPPVASSTCVLLSLPPLLVICHLLYRLPRCPSSSASRRIDAHHSTEPYNRRPHEILHISPSQLAKELSLCIGSSSDEKRNNIDIVRVEEGEEEDEKERRELLHSLKLTQDLTYVVEVLEGKKSETFVGSRDDVSRRDQEADIKRLSRKVHLRQKAWRKEKTRQEKREIDLLQNVLSLLAQNTREEESQMERGDQALYPSPPIQEKEEERERHPSSSSSSSDVFQQSILSSSSYPPPPPHTYPPQYQQQQQQQSVPFDSTAPSSSSSSSLFPHS